MENNTTRQREEWRCYKQLYFDEEERDKDWRKALLTTPEYVSVLKRFGVPQGGAQVSEHCDTRIRRFSFLKEKKQSIFFFYEKKSLLLFLSYLFFSSKVTHARSIHKYTQPVMLTHYSTAERLTPICHAWSQAFLCVDSSFEDAVNFCL